MTDFSFIGYMAASAIVMIVGVIAYRLLMETKAPPAINRKILIALYVMTFLISLSVFFPEPRHETVIEIGKTEVSGIVFENDVVERQSSFNIHEVIIWLTKGYFVGIITMLISFFYAFIRLRRLRRKSSLYNFQGIEFYVHEDKSLSSFSWFNKIFIYSGALEGSKEELSLLLLHEKSHITHRHYLDLVIAQIVLTVQWFNPAAWYLRRELQRIHEYEADENVITTGVGITKYQLLLINNIAENRFSSMINGLNNCLLKKRFLMMKKRNFGNRWKMGTIILGGILLLSGFFIRTPEIEATIKTFHYVTDETVPITISEANKNVKTEFVSNPGNVEIRHVESLPKVESLKKTVDKTNQNTIEEGLTKKKQTDIRYFSENPEAYISVEKSAAYEGGDRQLARDLRSVISYPTEALKEEKQGRVIVAFQINIDGTISDCKVVYSHDDVFNEAAVKAVESLPGKWTPGEVNGKPVNSIFNLPVTFRLPD